MCTNDEVSFLEKLKGLLSRASEIKEFSPTTSLKNINSLIDDGESKLEKIENQKQKGLRISLLDFMRNLFNR